MLPFASIVSRFAWEFKFTFQIRFNTIFHYLVFHWVRSNTQKAEIFTKHVVTIALPNEDQGWILSNLYSAKKEEIAIVTPSSVTRSKEYNMSSNKALGHRRIPGEILK